jgi:hypothetical protein
MRDNIDRIRAAAFNPDDKKKLGVALNDIADLLKNFDIRIEQLQTRLDEYAHLQNP